MVECVSPAYLLLLMALAACFGFVLAMLIVRIIFAPRIRAIEDSLNRRQW